ncbi:MAG: DUF1501 domain-containing protein [Planctomycetota bacterium]|nr:DUF1501 domain-containing protein [Planctomycetota bacterium]
MTINPLNRRNFLKASFGSALGLAATRMAWTSPDKRNYDPDFNEQGEFIGNTKSGPACIILWLQGGPSQLETWDPKPNHKNGGSTKTIKTKTPGLLLPSAFPRLAARSDMLNVVRSLHSKEGDHNRATYFVKTGQKPLANMRFPTFGAVAAYAAQESAGEAILPPYLRIGPNRPGLPDQGYLSSEFSPFLVDRANSRIRDLQAPKDLSASRQKRRAGLLEKMEKEYSRKASPGLVQRRRKAIQKALGFRGKDEIKAFDLSQESARTRSRYGQNNFGQSCLMARRLVENGVRCVEVVQDGWDTHENNFQRTSQLGNQLDQGFSALLDDLKARKMLSKTLILCMGEFGRTPVINKRGGRDHFPSVFGAVLAGRNIKSGVYGESSKDGLSIVKNPVTIPDLFATTVKAMGLSPSKEFQMGERPITLSKGKVIKDILKG